MQRYELVEEECENEDLGKYVSYGIACRGEGVLVSDVTPSRGAMVKFIETANKLDLSPIHVHDAVLDFLGMEYGY